MTTKTHRWKDEPQKVATVRASVKQTYSGPWGLKASSLDVVRDAGDALGLDLAADALDAAADDLWDWECEQPSPFAEGLAPGSVVPVAEIAGDRETADWETLRVRTILDLLQHAAAPDAAER